jgi:hypothetical protein
VAIASVVEYIHSLTSVNLICYPIRTTSPTRPPLSLSNVVTVVTVVTATTVTATTVTNTASTTPTAICLVENEAVQVFPEGKLQIR